MIQRQENNRTGELRFASTGKGSRPHRARLTLKQPCNNQPCNNTQHTNCPVLYRLALGRRLSTRDNLACRERSWLEVRPQDGSHPNRRVTICDILTSYLGSVVFFSALVRGDVVSKPTGVGNTISFSCSTISQTIFPTLHFYSSL